MPNILIVLVSGLAALLGAGWLGLRFLPKPFAPHPADPEAPADLASVDLPDGLPAPVRRYAKVTIGDRLPVVRTAVISGRGWLRFGPVTVPARFRFYHLAGRSYHHSMQATWFGLPILRVEESYHRGRSLFKMPFGTLDNDPATNRAACMGLWAESIWLPTILFTDPRVRWEADGDAAARLTYPYGEIEDSLLFRFDPASGLPVEIIGMRNRGKAEEFIEWRNVALRWQTLNAIQIPIDAETIWADQGYAWARWRVERVDYNVDVSARLPEG